LVDREQRGVFGRTPWAARLPIALSYLLSVWLVWRIGRRLAPGAEPMAALAFATMLLPFGASQYVSTDFPLVAFQTLALYAYVESRFNDPRAIGWFSLMSAAFALAFMTKGPPALLPLLALVAHEWLAPYSRPRPLLRWSQALIFLALAVPWYLAMIDGHSGLLEYFLGAEVVDRFASDDFNRHGEWYGWLAGVRADTAVGDAAVDAGIVALVARRCPPECAVGASARPGRRMRPSCCWCCGLRSPCWCFCVARSRMPLYVLAAVRAVGAAGRRGSANPKGARCRDYAGSRPGSAPCWRSSLQSPTGRRTRTPPPGPRPSASGRRFP
jgi:4-amino-4-deoxy-L-arabinose transferase-like glycosyltransferase